MIAAIYARKSTDQHIAERGELLMVPVEVTAFGLLALCAILLAVVLAVRLLPRPMPGAARAVMLLVLVVVVVVAIYVWATTRIQ